MYYPPKWRERHGLWYDGTLRGAPRRIVSGKKLRVEGPMPTQGKAIKFAITWQGNWGVRFSLAEARKLRDWLDQAIAWVELHRR